MKTVKPADYPRLDDTLSAQNIILIIQSIDENTRNKPKTQRQMRRRKELIKELNIRGIKL